MRIALIQFNATGDKANNIARAVHLVEQALQHKAKFVLLPEIFHWRGDTATLEKFNVAEKIPGPSLQPFMALAKKYHAHILAGSILEKSTTPKKIYNTSVLIDDHGKLVRKYRKIHLFDARLGDKIMRERDTFIAGRKKVLAPVNEFTVGLSICYDVRFSDLYRSHAIAGANVLVVPSCFTKPTGEAHWEALLRARAIESLAFVLAPNQVGVDGRGMPAYGHSMVVAPWGEILAQGDGSSEDIVYADITLDAVKAARVKLPSLIQEKRYGKQS